MKSIFQGLKIQDCFEFQHTNFHRHPLSSYKGLGYSVNLASAWPKAIPKVRSVFDRAMDSVAKINDKFHNLQLPALLTLLCVLLERETPTLVLSVAMTFWKLLPGPARHLASAEPAQDLVFILSASTLHPLLPLHMVYADITSSEPWLENPVLGQHFRFHCQHSHQIVSSQTVVKSWFIHIHL